MSHRVWWHIEAWTTTRKGDHLLRNPWVTAETLDEAHTRAVRYLANDSTTKPVVVAARRYPRNITPAA